MARSSNNDDPGLSDILKAQQELEDKIAAAQAIPEQLELEIREKESTIPAPDDLVERERAKRFEEQATRGQVRNERRTQGKSLILLFLLLLATAALILWIVKLAGQ
jgi:hypothetical protein